MPPEGDRYRLRTVRRAKLRENDVQVGLYAVHGYAELLGDVGIGQSARDGMEDVQLASGKFRRRRLLPHELQVETADLGGRFAVTLSAAKPAFYVWANAWKIQGEFDDNLLALMPGERRTIVFTPAERSVSFDAFRKSLSVANLYGAKKER